MGDHQAPSLVYMQTVVITSISGPPHVYSRRVDAQQQQGRNAGQQRQQPQVAAWVHRGTGEGKGDWGGVGRPYSRPFLKKCHNFPFF